MTLNVCVKPSERIIERPGLFVDCFHNTICPESTGTLEHIANGGVHSGEKSASSDKCVRQFMRNRARIFQLETAISHLAAPSLVRNYLRQIESTLFASARLPCIPAAKKLQAALLREATESTICCDQMFQGTTHGKILLYC